ncbi:MAG: AarF/ABC1/UbiB kinase family protein [Myxococcota bacterium]|nr:AarF/ABC1/UbiB kinase family protein [Myxococcota bacterium]
MAAPVFSTVARLDRARRLGVTVGRVYLGMKANQLLDGRLPRATMQRRWQRFHRQSAESVYETAVDLRGLILKGCQYLGARADLMPREWVEVLSRLQDRVPPHGIRVVRRIVERELGRPLGEVFARFEQQPIASASLAQVHEAELLDGRRVAVKVQYPEIARLMRSDLANLRALFRTIDLLEPDFDLSPLVEEFGRQIPRELDFLAEAANAERIRQIFAARTDVHVPAVHRELTTRRVLVMEFADGIKITDRRALEAAGVDRERVLLNLATAYADQILVHGFFQADPHPGNLLVDPDGPRLVLLDFGLAKELPPGFRANAGALLMAALRGDAEALADSLVQLGFATRDGSRQSLVDLASAGLAIASELRERGSLGPDRLERLGAELVERLRANPVIRVPADIVLLARTLGLLSGVARSLGTRGDPMRGVFPFLRGAT